MINLERWGIGGAVFICGLIIVMLIKLGLEVFA